MTEFSLKDTTNEVNAYIEANFDKLVEQKAVPRCMKKFYQSFFWFKAKRHKYNPLRLIFGDYYWTHDPMKVDIDVKDVHFQKKEV